MVPLRDGDRSHVLTSTDGGVTQRWVLIDSEHHRPQAQRTVDQQRRKERIDAPKAFQQLCHTACACAADVQQAVSAFVHGWYATALSKVTIQAMPRDYKRGSPAQGTQPDQVANQREGALTSSIAAH